MFSLHTTLQVPDKSGQDRDLRPLRPCLEIAVTQANRIHSQSCKILSQLDLTKWRLHPCKGHLSVCHFMHKLKVKRKFVLPIGMKLSC